MITLLHALLDNILWAVQLEQVNTALEWLFIDPSELAILILVYIFNSANLKYACMVKLNGVFSVQTHSQTHWKLHGCMWKYAKMYYMQPNAFNYECYTQILW